MQGAPQLTNAWGCMTALLDAVLVNGFNLKSIATLTSTGDIATATISAGHLFEVGQVVLIAGASQAEYNGEVRVLSVTSNTFTYAVTGTPESPATGTITVKAAPLGFEIAFTGTNKRAYRSQNVASNRPYLRVDDGLDPVYTTTYAKYAKVTMAQGMSDIDTFVGLRAPYNSAYPTRNEVGTGSGTTAYGGWYKWYYAKASAAGSLLPDTTAPSTYNRPWFIIGDDRGFYLFNEAIDMKGMSGKCFTDFESYRSADGFNSILCAQYAYFLASSDYSVDTESSNSSDWRSRFARTQDTMGKVLMCSYLQTGVNVNPSFTSLNTNNSQSVTGYSTGISFPNGPDYSLLIHPTLLKEGSHLRGKMPGMMWILNESPAFNHLDTITGVAGYSGRTFKLVNFSHGTSTSAYVNAMLAYDLTGPWW